MDVIGVGGFYVIAGGSVLAAWLLVLALGVLGARLARRSRRRVVVVALAVSALLVGASTAYADQQLEAEGSTCTGGTVTAAATGFSGGSYRDGQSTSATARIVCTTGNIPAHSTIQVGVTEVNGGTYGWAVDGAIQTARTSCTCSTAWTIIADTGAKPTMHTFSMWRTTAVTGAYPQLDVWTATSPECDANLGRTPAPGGGCAMVVAAHSVTVANATPWPVTVANATPWPVATASPGVSGGAGLTTAQGQDLNRLAVNLPALGAVTIFLLAAALTLNLKRAR